MRLPRPGELAVRRWALRTALATVAASAICVAGLFLYAWQLRQKLGIGDAALAAVRVGMTEAQVAGPLAAAGFERREPALFSAIHALPANGSPVPVITHEWRKTVETFFLPVTWAVSMDATGTVVQTHRYD